MGLPGFFVYVKRQIVNNPENTAFYLQRLICTASAGNIVQEDSASLDELVKLLSSLANQVETNPRRIRNTSEMTTETQTKVNYWVTSDELLADDAVEKIQEEIRYKTLVKNTNVQFLEFIEDLIKKKAEDLEKIDDRIDEKYQSLNRTAKAARELKSKKGDDFKQMLKNKVSKLQQELASLSATYELQDELFKESASQKSFLIAENIKRIKRGDANPPTVAPADGKPVYSKTKHFKNKRRKMYRGQNNPYKPILKHDNQQYEEMTECPNVWKALSKYNPFRKEKGYNFREGIPLNIEYRLSPNDLPQHAFATVRIDKETRRRHHWRKHKKNNKIEKGYLQSSLFKTKF